MYWPAQSFCKHERGSAAVIGILVMMLLGIMGAGYIALSSTEVNISADFRDGVAAQYLAEAGARRAIMELYNNKDWTGLSEEMGDSDSVTRGRYTVTVTTPIGDTSRRLVVSTGQVNRARRQLVFYVNMQSDGGAVSVYDNAVFSGSSMVIHNKAHIIGSTRSNGSLELKNNSQISGDVRVHGKYTDHGAILTKDPIKNAPIIDFPIFDANEYEKGATLLPPDDGSDNDNDNGNGKGKDKDKSNGNSKYAITGGTYQGKYYYDANQKPLEIDSNAQNPVKGSATIFATGDIVIGPGSVVGNSNSDYFLLIAQGNITVHSNARLQNVVLIALGGDITIDSDVQMTGAAIAKTELIVHGGGNSATTIKWDAGIMQHFGLPTSGQTKPFGIESYKPYQPTRS